MLVGPCLTYISVVIVNGLYCILNRSVPVWHCAVYCIVCWGSFLLVVVWLCLGVVGQLDKANELPLLCPLRASPVSLAWDLLLFLSLRCVGKPTLQHSLHSPPHGCGGWRSAGGEGPGTTCRQRDPAGPAAETAGRLLHLWGEISPKGKWTAGLSADVASPHTQIAYHSDAVWRIPTIQNTE